MRKVALLLAFVIVVLLFLALVYWRNASAPAVPEGAKLISNWCSPTASLLRSPSDPLLRQVPRLGETYFKLEAEKNAK